MFEVCADIGGRDKGKFVKAVIDLAAGDFHAGNSESVDRNAGATTKWPLRSPIKTSMATVCLSGSLEQKIAAIAAAGFNGLELFESDLIGCSLSPQQISRRVAEAGLTIDLYQPYRDLDSTDADEYKRRLRSAIRKFDTMEKLGARTLLVCSSCLPSAVRDDGMLADQLWTAAEEAHRRGIVLAYEALAWGTHVNRYRHAWDVVRQADHPALGLCLDSFHILARGENPAEIADIPGEKIAYVQLADAPWLTMDAVQWSRHHRCFPGQGDFDLATFCAHLLESGYRGPWSLEIFNDIFRWTSPVRTATEGHRSLLYLQSQVAELSPRATDRLLFAPPKPGPVAEPVCLRLAAGPDHSPVLGTTLRHLGFDLAAAQSRHGQQLFTHGPLAVIVDQADPSACRPGLTHIGIHCGRTAEWYARAAAFGVPAEAVTMTGPDGGGVDVVRVAVTDDASFDLQARACATTWPAPFDLVPQAEMLTAADFLTGVDHVSLMVFEDRMAGVALLLRSVFGMEPQEGEDIIDALGLVRSQAFTLGSSAGTLRLVLTSIPGSTSSAGAPRPQRYGGVGHIAFGTDDIVGAAEQMRRRGFEPLPIPANYYDDLAARVDVDPSWVGVMSDHGVLYATDSFGGEFYHFFTPVIGDEIFFEVVQRIGGYAGYGHANSAARLSAQYTYESLAQLLTA